MFDQLEIVENRYEQINELLSDPDVVSDTDKLRKYSKEQSDLQKTVDVYRTYKSVKTDIEDEKLMLEETDDKDDQEMLKDEINSLTDRIPELESELKFLLIPKAPTDEKNVISEIRGTE